MAVWAPEVGPTNDPIPLAPALGEALGETTTAEWLAREREDGFRIRTSGLKSELPPQILAGLGCRGSIT